MTPQLTQATAQEQRPRRLKYRSYVEIEMTVLGFIIAEGEQGKTKIMYKAFMSYEQLKGYLSDMMAAGFLKFNQKTELYNATEKGREYHSLLSKAFALRGTTRSGERSD